LLRDQAEIKVLKELNEMRVQELEFRLIGHNFHFHRILRTEAVIVEIHDVRPLSVPRTEVSVRPTGRSTSPERKSAVGRRGGRTTDYYPIGTG
jgi:hypothetical protein